MKIGKLLLTMSLVLALLIPQLVVASVSPVRDSQPDRVEGTINDGPNATSSGSSYQDTRGRVQWFGNLFPWQIEAWFRYLERWGMI